ncbi:MAG: menaquinone biosynthesis protein [Rikenellaceae bacterium]
MKRGAITAVCYLNTVPFVFGINRATEKLHDALLLSVPSKCASNFIEKKSNIALIPAADLPLLENYQIITDYCIGASDFVRSVVVMSDSELSQIETIYLDSHSHTSVALVQILCREYWHISPKFESLTDYDSIKKRENRDSKAGYLLIGDKVFDFEGKFNHTFDLAHEWKLLTGMPFVFAVWVARPEVTTEHIELLRSSLKYGIEHIESAVDWAKIGIDREESIDYLKNSIDFDFNSEKRAALSHFLQKIPPSPRG